MNQAQQPQRLTRRKIPTTEFAQVGSAVPAWLLSLLLHCALLVLLGTFWTVRPKGTSSDQGGPIGIAVAVETAGEEQYYLMDESESAEASERSALSGLPSMDAAAREQQELLSGMMPQLEAGGGVAASGDLGLGEGSVALPAGGRPGSVKAKLFGLEGEGSRFVYVIDRSDSMNGYAGKPMRNAKSELLQSLESLGPTHQFQIVFYNDTPTAQGGSSARGPQLLRGDDRGKQSAARFVQEMAAAGGTNHLDALRLALAMGPDVLFFLTDGDLPKLSGSEIENILTRAARSGTTIHSIQFGEGPRTARSNWISELAEMSGGSFRYIDVIEF
jgi:hypothetical protein